MNFILTSPFGGEIRLVFHSKDRAIVYSETMNPISINGVKMSFRVELGIIDGQWEIGFESCGKFVKNSASNLRLHDWASRKTPSDSAYRKMNEYLNGVLTMVRSGKFNDAAIEGEKNRLKNAITRRKAEIEQKLKEIVELENENHLLQNELDKLV